MNAATALLTTAVVTTVSLLPGPAQKFQASGAVRTEQMPVEDKVVIDRPECEVCNRPFDEGLSLAKLLPCHHTLCAKCVTDMRRADGSLTCPTDGTVVQVPVVTDLPRNIELMRIANAHSEALDRAARRSAERTFI